MKTHRIIKYITSWLADYCNRSKMAGFAVGISGGVDSALTSALCASTGMPTHAISMPIHQPADQALLAGRHISWLTSRYACVHPHITDLTPVLEGFRQALPPDVQNELVMANTRSRIRMTALYAFAGARRLLVAGTGNKVEDFGVGFFTKYGDGGVDISPIADLMKSEVRILAREMGIVREIVDAVPTDGLFPDSRSDEEQIGASYDELEWAMGMDEAGDVSEEAFTARQKEVLSIYRRFNRANRHKVSPIPVAKIPDDLRA